MQNIPSRRGGGGRRGEAKGVIIFTANFLKRKAPAGGGSGAGRVDPGVKTGQALWQAKIACSDLVIVPPRMDLYLKFSSMLREIYGEYTNLVEPYGCDEAWLDVTDSTVLKRGRKENRRGDKQEGEKRTGNYSQHWDFLE